MSSTLTMIVTLIIITLLLAKIIGKPSAQTMTLMVQVKILKTARGKDLAVWGMLTIEGMSRKV
jgi:hypothetical protein